MFRSIRLLIACLLCLQAGAQQVVLRGDYPDPSVVKIGTTYWASATTSNWMPAYPLLQSKDLVNWKTTGSVFTALPSWADYYFWAPEMTVDKGKVYVYYAAHKKGGNLCIGVATAARPQGPYKDLGPLVCQADGSIDAFPMRDENGKLHLIWKEDGNSIKQPTPIWIQELSESRTALIGTKKELFRNDAGWEGKLVEGVSMIRHGGWFYTFYAAAGCCGNGCTYNTGIARAKSLVGPWEKYEKNPVLISEYTWKCPGHGTPVEKDGRFYFMYHAYDTAGTIYTGREGLIKEFRFTEDGWITFIENKVTRPIKSNVVKDNFNGKILSANWQWSVFQKVQAKQLNGYLQLSALPEVSGALLGQRTTEINYEVITEVDRSLSKAAPGLALIGDDKNTVATLLIGTTLRVVQIKEGRASVIFTQSITYGSTLRLHMQVRNGKDVTFFYEGKNRSLIALNTQPIDGSFLPPWDRGLRAGLVAKGSIGTKAVFNEFSMMRLEKK